MNAGIGCYINAFTKCYVHIVFNAILMHIAQMLYPCTCTRRSIHACIECNDGAWIGCDINAYIGCYINAYIGCCICAYISCYIHAMSMHVLDDIFMYIFHVI